MNLRLRVLLLLLAGAVVWLFAARQREARAELDALGQQAAAAARRDVAGREAEARHHRLAAVLDRIQPGPASATEVRGLLLGLGADLPALHFQPLQRPPPGAGGTELRLTATGSPGELVRLLERLEAARLPLRFDRTELAVRAVGPATLTTGAAIFWPDPDTPPDPVRLAADPRLDDLAAWLAAPPAVAPAPPPPRPARRAPVTAAVEVREPPRAEQQPALRGFVGSGARLEAMFALGGTVTMAGAGDPVGAYTVLALEPPAVAVLVRPGQPPLRLVLE